MRDIGGKLFVALDAFIQRRHHAAQRAGQAANFVGARGKIGDAHAGRRHFAGVFVAANFGSGGQIGKRICDGRGKDQAKHNADH